MSTECLFSVLADEYGTFLFCRFLFWPVSTELFFLSFFFFLLLAGEYETFFISVLASEYGTFLFFCLFVFCLFFLFWPVSMQKKKKFSPVSTEVFFSFLFLSGEYGTLFLSDLAGEYGVRIF